MDKNLLSKNHTSPTSKWRVDAALFSAFMAAFLLDLTGLELHQWLGVAAAALATYHLVTHWNWASAVTRRFFGKTSGKMRVYYLIDASILIGFFTIALTGLVISSWLNLALANAAAWAQVHIWASIATLVLTVIKIGLHWRWVVSVAKKVFGASPAPHRQPVPVASGMLGATPRLDRREFLQLMGAVSLASVIALTRAAGGLSQDEQAGLQTGSQRSLETKASSELPSSEASSNTSCRAQCPRGCAYPGGCRRYTDTNSNNRCDFGECI